MMLQDFKDWLETEPKVSYYLAFLEVEKKSQVQETLRKKHLVTTEAPY